MFNILESYFNRIISIKANIAAKKNTATTIRKYFHPSFTIFLLYYKLSSVLGKNPKVSSQGGRNAVWRRTCIMN